MSIVEPLPVGGYGKADWVDYSNYWREGDAEWLMERSVLRYADATARTAQWPTPKFGHVTYNEATDRLETFSKVANAWSTVQQYVNLVSTQDTTGGVAISHKTAGSKGIIFEPTRTQLDNPIWVMGGVLGVDGTGVTVKTGAKTVKLTTNATDLVSDSPISGTTLTLSGTLTGVNATLSGTLTSPNIAMSGTLTGGVLNGTSGTIGGIGIASNIITIPAGGLGANAAGIQASQGYFYGDANGALIRQRTSAGVAPGAPYVQVTSSIVGLNGTTVEFVGQPKVLSNRSVQYVTTAGLMNGGPVIVQTSDPGVANVPEGTIWINA